MPSKIYQNWEIWFEIESSGNPGRLLFAPLNKIILLALLITINIQGCQIFLGASIPKREKYTK
jgi:hypothetical protein